MKKKQQFDFDSFGEDEVFDDLKVPGCPNWVVVLTLIGLGLWAYWGITN